MTNYVFIHAEQMSCEKRELRSALTLSCVVLPGQLPGKRGGKKKKQKAKNKTNKKEISRVSAGFGFTGVSLATAGYREEQRDGCADPGPLAL